MIAVLAVLGFSETAAAEAECPNSLLRRLLVCHDVARETYEENWRYLSRNEKEELLVAQRACTDFRNSVSREKKRACQKAAYEMFGRIGWNF